MAPQAAPPTPQQIEADANRAENVEAIVGTTEDGVADRGESEQPQQGQGPNDPDAGLSRREVIPRSPSDDARNAIASRFRRAEPADERPFNGDMNDQENLYGEVGREADDEDDTAEEIAALTGQQPQPKPAEQTEKRMITRVVRGQNVTLSEEEWLDRASQVTAADSYLAEAREMLAQAKEIKAGRTSPDRQHPDGQNRAQTDELGNDPVDLQAQHPEPSFRDVVEKIQFGDPDEAAKDLESIVDRRANKVANEGQLQRAVSQDLARSKKALTAFADANPELANDEIAAMAIERGMYRLYKEEMVGLGLSEAQLPKTSQQLADWHRYYRINGYEVSQTGDLLNKSKDSFLKWRNGNKAPATQQQPSRPQKPRVEVNVDREARRMAIPNQPNRGVTPRRDVQQPRQQTGSDVVANMRRARGQI